MGHTDGGSCNGWGGALERQLKTDRVFQLNYSLALPIENLERCNAVTDIIPEQYPIRLN